MSANVDPCHVYWVDCLTRALPNRDMFTRMFPLDELARHPGALGGERAPELYERVRSELMAVVSITHGDQEAQVASAIFAAQFGWTLANHIGKIHLGNLCVTPDASIKVGNRSYISGHAHIHGNGNVVIGSYCSLATDLTVFSSNVSHPTQFPSTYNLAGNSRIVEDGLQIEATCFEDYARTRTARAVDIGHDVWIGRSVTIMNGVKIGNGAVVGTHALVTKDCEPYGIYGGVPAKLIRHRFHKDIVAELEEICWWDWDSRQIAKHSAFFDTDLTTYVGNVCDLVRDVS